MKFKVVATFLLSSFAMMTSYGHGGGLNAEGCHHNRKTGDYHCHRAPVTRAALASTAIGTPGQTPKCFTGPRGGTYTITPSGRKNYNGC